MIIRYKTCSSLIVLFYSVGLLGFLYPPAVPLFKQLVPFHLLLMTGLLIANQHVRNQSFWLFLGVAYVAGFLIEMVGTQTGMVFGSYFYGETLGYKIFNTPLMIGVNWFLVIYSVGMALSELKVENVYAFILLGASSVTLLDFFIEPVAMKFDYWDWAGGVVPVQNYVVWFIFSALLLLVFYKSYFPKISSSAAVLFVVQFLFFLILYLNV
ncbi:putative membrane protein [Arcticibacter pallidicorallinus]|uniref:Putative membrane protein n=1 Tax=Arcticibacter pallidicorallinus TaxID=1259464 RepID=A0A2T0U9F2_9SPHI|nr:carotenoid biosynthesis protein [Arcticibacter pallidicorallinus]PRY54550.1 putative membrane protein [Arcticibacter pallidicorallinus]